jgi:hypothetical protein
MVSRSISLLWLAERARAKNSGTPPRREGHPYLPTPTILERETELRTRDPQLGKSLEGFAK